MSVEATEGAASAPGMPQLDITTFSNQIFWLVIAIVVIYLILSRVALPRIGAVLAERQGTITNDIAAAEDLERQAAEAEVAYNKALADARSEAQAIAAEARAEIMAELGDATVKADAEISAKAAESSERIAEIQAGALEAVKTVARDTATEIVAALAPTAADEAGIVAAVATRVKG